MGKKVNPIIYRISNIKNPSQTWHSKWFGNRHTFSKFLEEDNKIRKSIRMLVEDVGLDKIGIERSGQGNLEIILPVSKPGVIIGRGGEKSEKLKKSIQKIIGGTYKVKLTIKEIPKANLCAEVLADEAKNMIERRMPFRRVMKKTLDLGKKAGALGIKICMAGRLNGAEIARTEKLASGRMPLHNLRADLDYARLHAHTKWGQIGIKIWVFKGEVFEEEKESE